MKLSESIVESKRIRLPDRDDRIAKNNGPAREAAGLRTKGSPILPETVQLRWVPPSGLTFATGIEFILRCIEEWTESTESVENHGDKHLTLRNAFCL